MSGESGKQFKIDVEDLYATAPAFRRAGGTLDDALTQLKPRLEALGDFWGSDQLGRKFGSIYLPGSEKLLELLNIVSGAVDGVADGIVKTAEKYDATERENTAKIQSLNEDR